MINHPLNELPLEVSLSKVTFERLQRYNNAKISIADYEEREDGRVYFYLAPDVHNVLKGHNPDIEQALIKMLNKEINDD